MFYINCGKDQFMWWQTTPHMEEKKFHYFSMKYEYGGAGNSFENE